MNSQDFGMGTKINIEELFQSMVIQGASAPKQAPTPPQSTGSDLDSAYPLHDACARGYLDKVKIYVEARQVDVNQRGQPPQRWCPLHCTGKAFAQGTYFASDLPALCAAAFSLVSWRAAFSEVKSLEVARYLLENGANPSSQDEDGWTALHFAATKGHVELVELLLRSRADHAIKDNDGFTALHEAARNNHTQVVDLLLASKAQIDVRVVKAQDMRPLFKVPRVFAAAMKIGRSPLHWAAANGHMEVVERLCEAQADVSSVDGNFDTPLFMAAANGKVSVMKLLIKFNADVRQTHDSMWNLLHQAAANGQVEVLQMGVRDLKLDSSEADLAKHTPLHVAVLRQHRSAVKTLIDLGARVNELGPSNYTPLQYACRWNCQEIGLCLIESKADVDLCDDEGWTPLHWACASDSLACIPLLILAGANQSVRDQHGLMPVDVASDAARAILFQSVSMRLRQQAPMFPGAGAGIGASAVGLGGAQVGVGYSDYGGGYGVHAAERYTNNEMDNEGGGADLTGVGVQYVGHSMQPIVNAAHMPFGHELRGAPHMVAVLGGGGVTLNSGGLVVGGGPSMAAEDMNRPGANGGVRAYPVAAAMPTADAAAYAVPIQGGAAMPLGADAMHIGVGGGWANVDSAFALPLGYNSHSMGI